jgi:long-chain acyl-CoA synthetase
MVTGPLYHAAPLLFAFYDQVNGAPLVILPQWDDARALELLQERAIRRTHMVPTMFVRMLNLPEGVRSRFDPSALRLVLHGAAPMSVAVKRRMIDWWGEVLVEYWGATEGGATTLVDSADWLAHPGTVGRALPSFEVFAVDDQGERLPPGEVGVLYCRHKTLRQVFEYHRAPEQTAEAHPEPFLFNIGDVGRVEEDGYVYLSDRKSNLIISGGVNIYPAEIEQVLQEHPAVADVGVFGIPDPEWGEAVKAAVELHPGRQPSPELEAEIRAFARERLADYKVPRSIDFENRLPRYPTGKLHVRLLRDRYWKQHDRNI